MVLALVRRKMGWLARLPMTVSMETAWTVSAARVHAREPAWPALWLRPAPLTDCAERFRREPILTMNVRSTQATNVVETAPVMVLAPVDCRSPGLHVEVHPAATQSLPRQESATAVELVSLQRLPVPAQETFLVRRLQHVRQRARIGAPQDVCQATSALVEAPVSWLLLTAEAQAARSAMGASVALKIPTIPGPTHCSFA